MSQAEVIHLGIDRQTSRQTRHHIKMPLTDNWKNIFNKRLVIVFTGQCL